MPALGESGVWPGNQKAERSQVLSIFCPIKQLFSYLRKVSYVPGPLAICNSGYNYSLDRRTYFPSVVLWTSIDVALLRVGKNESF